MFKGIVRAGLPLFCILGPHGVEAAPWKSERSSEVRFQHLQLISKDQNFRREEPVATLGGRYRLIGEGIASQWRHELGLDLGKSLKRRTNYQVLSGRSTLTLPGPRSTQTLSLGVQHSRGNDPINQAVELVLANENPKPFTSVQAGFTHQHDFSVQHALGVELGLSHNVQGDFNIQTQDLQVAYTYRATRLSTTKLRLRQSEQQAKDTEPYHASELGVDQLLALSQTLSVDGSVAYGIRRQGDQNGQGLLYLGAISYNTEHQAEDDTAALNSFKAKKKQDRPDIKDNRGLRGASVFRVGTSRSSDQRRAGDPIFIADQIFASWGLSVNRNHALQLNLRQTKSKDEVSTLGARLKEDAIELSYRWNHELGSDRQPMGGVLGVEASGQATKEGERDYRRQVYTMLYGLVF